MATSPLSDVLLLRKYFSVGLADSATECTDLATDSFSSVFFFEAGLAFVAFVGVFVAGGGGGGGDVDFSSITVMSSLS